MEIRYFVYKDSKKPFNKFFKTEFDSSVGVSKQWWSRDFNNWKGITAQENLQKLDKAEEITKEIFNKMLSEEK